MTTIASSRPGFGARLHSFSIAMGVLLLAAGLLSIAAPAFAGIAASIFFGWLVLLAGAAHLVYAWSERGAGHILWQILVGAVYIAAALYMLLVPLGGMAALTLVLGVYIGLAGILEIGAFVSLRHWPRSGWFLAGGLVSLLLAGLILFRWPSSSFWALGTLVGVSLLFSGMARLMLPMGSRVTAVGV